MKKFLTNAFSIQMLERGGLVRFEEISLEDIPSDVVSAVGHADTANVLTSMLGFEVPVNRTSITLDTETELFVAQLVGGRLPEGSTTLPEGFRFKFFRVKIVQKGTENHEIDHDSLEKEAVDYCPGCNVAYCRGRYTTGQCE